MQLSTAFITIKTILLFSLFTLCSCGGGGGGGGKSDSITIPISSSSSSTGLSLQLLTFSEQTVVELQSGESIARVATGQGTGSVTYKSSDTWIASVDGTGSVIAKNPGAVTITATKAADNNYLSATSSYSLKVSNGSYLNAWIGSSDTLLNFPTFAKGAELYRSSASECDFLNYTSCPDSKLTVLQNLTENDAANLNKPGYFLLKSDKGAVNVGVNLKSSFTSRFAPAVVSFKGRLWIIGGSKDKLQNDIWSSTDGINWKLETPAAAFSPRMLHKVIEHNDRLYLMGGIIGNDGTSNLWAHDIWSSSDGVNWVLVTDHLAVSFRWETPLISFNNKLWLIGGSFTGEGDSNEIWSSADGKNWTLELASAAFSPRIGHKLISYQNKLWLFGGADQTQWSSIDGINWIREAETTGFTTSFQVVTPIVYDNKLWLLGDNPQLIYFSQNGVSWTQAPAEPSYEDRNGARILTFDNQIWLIGGEVIHDTKRSLREVWVSTDAHRWKLKTTDAPFPRRTSHTVISHNGNLFLIGGHAPNHTFIRNDVWSSANGINWDIRTVSAAFAPRITHKVASFKEKLWLIGQDFAGGYPDDVWSSNDGVSWLKESDNLWNLTEPSAKTDQLFSFNNELWLLGSVERPPKKERIPALWSSKDGLSWQLRTSADVPGFYADNRDHQVIVFKNKLWLIYAGVMQAWSSTDGVIWKKDDISGGNWGHRDYQLTVFKDKIWMIGGSDFTQGGFGVLAKDIWSSSDGINWKQEINSTNFPARIGHQVIALNDQLLLFGGDGGDEFSTEDDVGGINNEIWSSTDGVEWRRGYQVELKTIH